MFLSCFSSILFGDFKSDNKATGDALHHLAGRVTLQRKTDDDGVMETTVLCRVAVFPGVDLM